MGLFEEYKNHPDKDVRDRANNWGAAIGLQNVDRLSVSEFLIQLARQQIEGEITMEEVTQRLNEHYKHRKLYSSTYEIVPHNSEMIKRMKEENELRRPKMYEQNDILEYKAGDISFYNPLYAYWLKAEYFVKQKSYLNKIQKNRIKLIIKVY